MSDLPRSYVVTGAASGIGAAVTVLLRSQGAPGRDRRPAPPLKPEGMQVNPIALGILDKVASVATRLKALRARP